MNPYLVLSLDRLVGRPVVWLLSLYEGVRRLFRRPKAGMPRKILFLKLIEMGSTVLACPAFEAATRMVGKDNIYFMAFAPNRAIVDLLPYFRAQNIITIDDRNVFTFVMGLFKALGAVRRAKIDAVIDMEGLTRSSAIIAYLTGCATRVGYHNFTSEGPYRGRLFTHEVSYGFQHHTSKAFLALVRALMAPSDQVPMLKERIDDAALELPRFMPGPDELSTVKSTMRRLSHRDSWGKVVLLNPNCSDLLPMRRWPTENFVSLAGRLLERWPDALIVVTGAPSEQGEAQKVAARIGPPEQCISMAGHTTLRLLLAMYSISDLLITNDSGPSHFAALTPIRGISLFGPETPLLYAPLGGRTRTISAGLACSPCVNMLNHRFTPCNDNKCMQQISVDEVLACAVEQLETTD